MTEPLFPPDWRKDHKKKEQLVRLAEFGYELKFVLIEGAGKSTYVVDYIQCETPEQMLRRLRHLSRKDWFTVEMQQQLLDLWSEKTGFKL